MNTTIESAEITTPPQIEFCRTRDITRLFGLKPGTLYNLHRENKIRSAVLKVRGKGPKCRLWELASVRNFIASQMDKEAE